MQEHDESATLAPDQVGASPSLARVTCAVGRPTFFPNQDKRLDQVLDAWSEHQAVIGLLVPIDWGDVVDEEVDCVGS